MCKHPLFTLGIVLCSGPALGQAGPPPLYPTGFDKYLLPWPSGVTSGSFTRIEPGDFDGDGILDAAILKGVKTVLLIDPAISGAPLELACDANDIACLLGEALGGADALVTAEAGGLRLWDFDAVPAGEPQTLSPQALDTSGWLGARVVVAGQLDDDLDQDLLGVGADGRTVLFLENLGNRSFESLPSFQTSMPVVELGLLEWDGDPGPEVWTRTNRAVDVYELSGTRVANYRNLAPAAPVDGVAVLPHPQPGSPLTDQLAWATKVNATSPDQMLLVLFRGGYEPAPVLLGDLGVAALAAGDPDGDGDADLLMSAKDLHVLRRVENRKAQDPNQRTFEGYPVGTLDSWAGQSGPGAPPNLARFRWIDWDNDDALDLLYTAEPLTRPFLIPAVELQPPEPDENDPYELIASGHPAFASIDYTAASAMSCPGNTPTQGRLFIELNNPWGAPVASSNVFDLIVYEQPALSDPYPRDAALHHHRYPMNTAQIAWSPDRFRISVMIPQTSGLFAGRYFCQVRVILDADTPAQRNLRSYVGGFTSDVYEGTGIGSWQALMQLPDGWLASIPCEFDYCVPDHPGIVNGGGFRPLSRMPPFEPGHSPQPGPWTPPPDQ